ncbi:beta strand repeat-containing protein [Hymenobacter cellulosivorans]|uniref:T9SS type A sorting domain-containing protein n=1 Tax=Hymenobacter cellulosivorans TaxID=2932249 RepID=A0ABY4FD81_9BACT|nr:right-handed parallel beta-helix repeat-containing protein [Hymenobacter cellulosivorans]UOQ53924.1 T9SS type A sorting domain-containing protein [Hymenobacter cellulosivorans]
MTTILRVAALLLFWLVLAPTNVQAQVEGQAFSCDGTFYQIRQIGGGASAYSALYVVNRTTSNYTTNAYSFGAGNTTGNLGVVLNALAYNPQDSYLYAITYPADNGAPDAANGIHLYRIGRGGIRDLGKTNLPLAQYNSGTIDKQGNFYLTTRNSAGIYLNTLFRLKLSDFSTVLTSHDELPLVTSNGTTAATADFTDIAYSPTTNSIYGSSELNDLLRIEVTTVNGTEKGVLTTIATGNTSGDIVGSNFFDVAGNLYTYSNSGGIYSVNVTTGASTLISTVDAASNSDGASCINPSERIDVVKDFTGLTVSNNGRSGSQRQTYYDISFAIRVKNTGTTTTTNVQVSDYLNNTFGATPYSIQTGPVVTNYSINNGALPTLAANTAFDGATTDADLLTGTQSLTAGQSALITFTARLTFTGGTPAIPNTIFNNYAYASTTSGTTVNQGHVRLSNGTVIPPGNLLAQDQSTNDTTFPTTANGDTPSPTPIRLTASIQGTVFEDMNYGGGFGRTQLASNGQGVADVRVELYTGPTVTAANPVPGTFLTSVFTDASGNYEFRQLAGSNTVQANTAYQVRVVNSTVNSNRPNQYNNPVVGVQTYINGNNNQVGGANPNQVDVASNNSSTLTVLEASSNTTTIQSLTTVTTPASGPFMGVDFGYNFDLIVNTNDAGQGSLRQFVNNSNELANTGLAQEGQTAGQETAIFMLNDGSTNSNGLRSAFTAANYNATAKSFTINITSATQMWMYSGNTTIDGKLQSNRTGDIAATATSTSPEVIINFNNQQGIFVTGANTRIASLGLNNAKGTSTTTATLDPLQGAAFTFSRASATGSVFTDNTASGNATAGVRLDDGATGITISNNVLSNGASTAGNGTTITATDGGGIVLANASTNSITGNKILSNAGFGIEFQAVGTNNNNTISGNTISTNGGGTATTNRAGIAIRRGSNNLISTNTLNANVGDAILAFNGTAGNRFTQNSMFSNGTASTTDGTTKIGIDLMASGATSNGGDNVSLNADGKTSTSGANGLLNFPVITQARQDGTNLRVTGYAPLGATIEFFVADMTTSPSFGEGRYYLATRTEGLAGEDADPKSTAYSGTINGQNSGSEAAARRFAFVIPLSSLGTTERTALTATNARITATATMPETVNSMAVGNTSEFSGNAPVSSGVLPVELTAFTATAIGQNAQLSWTTASEKDNDHFVVERAYGEQAFAPIGTVKGAGNSQTARSYSFIDAGIGTKNLGTIYYRLKQVDTNGSEVQAGPVRTLTFGGAKEVTAAVYPNPAANEAQLDLSNLPAGSYQVSLVDATGRTLATSTYEGGALHPFSVRSLTAGSYLVVIRGNNLKITQRLVKN